MRLSFLSRATKSSFLPFGHSPLRSLIAGFALLFALTLVFSSSCAKKGKQEQQKPKSTPTSGSLAVFASPAVEPAVQAGADQFNRLYVNANVNVYPLDSRALVDSMVYGKADCGFFDRYLSDAESLKVVKTRGQLFAFELGNTVATWIVNPKNRVSTIDSVQALDILLGKTTSWKALGGPAGKINIYLPPIGDGAWQALEDFFGPALTKVDAHYWPSDSLVMQDVARDPNALGLVGKPVYDPKVKKLRWRDPLLAEPVPANIGTLQEGKYPFSIGLYYYSTGDKSDLASGFFSFLASNDGQRLLSDQGFLPGMVTAHVLTLSPSGENK